MITQFFASTLSSAPTAVSFAEVRHVSPARSRAESNKAGGQVLARSRSLRCPVDTRLRSAMAHTSGQVRNHPLALNGTAWRTSANEHVCAGKSAFTGMASPAAVADNGRRVTSQAHQEQGGTQIRAGRLGRGMGFGFGALLPATPGTLASLMRFGFSIEPWRGVKRTDFPVASNQWLLGAGR